MLAMCARIVPDIATAWRELPSALHLTWSPSFSTATLGSTGRAIVPSGPFTWMFCASTLNSTPLGSATGFLAIRDISASSGHDAENLAADAGVARLAVGHHAVRGREDRDPEAVHDPRDVVPALVDAQPRARHALELLDHRAPRVVLQADARFRLRALLAQREILDVSLVLQDVGEGGLQLRRRHLHFHMPDHLRVADAGQHVCDRIGHPHAGLLPARLDDARDFAAQRELAQLGATEPELAVHPSRPARECAAVAQPDGRSVARELLQLCARRLLVLVGDARALQQLEQRLPPRLEFRDRLAPFLLPQLQ